MNISSLGVITSGFWSSETFARDFDTLPFSIDESARRPIAPFDTLCVWRFNQV